jgi:hypothetical protein
MAVSFASAPLMLKKTLRRQQVAQLLGQTGLGFIVRNISNSV